MVQVKYARAKAACLLAAEACRKNAVRYFDIEVDDAEEISEQTEL